MPLQGSQQPLCRAEKLTGSRPRRGLERSAAAGASAGGVKGCWHRGGAGRYWFGLCRAPSSLRRWEGGDKTSMAAAGGERGAAAPREEAMASAGEEEDGEENILYDLLVNTEWPPETEVQVRVTAAWPAAGEGTGHVGAGGDAPRCPGAWAARGAGRPPALGNSAVATGCFLPGGSLGCPLRSWWAQEQGGQQGPAQNVSLRSSCPCHRLVSLISCAVTLSSCATWDALKSFLVVTC